MKSVIKDDDLGFVESLEVTILLGKLDGGLVGFETGIAEKATAQSAFFAKFGRHFFLQINTEVIRDMNQLGHLLLKRRHQSRMVMPDSIDGDTRKAVKIDIALRIGEPNAFPLLKTHGKRRENRQQVRLRHFD